MSRLEFEALIFDHSGGLEAEGNRLLISVRRAIHENLRRNIGSTCQILKYRISEVWGHLFAAI